MVDIALRLDGVSRYYGDVRAVDNLSLDIPSGRVRHAARPVRLRQEHDPQPDRRPGPARRGSHPPGRRGHHGHAAERAADGDGLPELRPLPAPVGVRQHRVRAQAPAPPEGRDQAARRRGGGGARHHPPDEAQAGRDVRRPAAARGAGARPGQGADGLPPRRAVQQPRRRPAQPDADGGQAPPPEAGDDERVRDPRPGGGDEPVRPDRGHARRQGRPARARPGRSTATRATSTSPRSSASPR